MSDPAPALARLRRSSRQAALRLRLDEAVGRLALLLPVPLVYAAAALTAVKVWRLPEDLVSTLLWVGALPALLPVGAVVHSLTRARAPSEGSLALDRHYGLHDRITSALAFESLDVAGRTPLMAAAIDDAVATARDVRPRLAAPVRFPRDLLASLALALAVAGILQLEVRTTRVVYPERSIDALAMSPDDVELLRETLRDLDEKSSDPEVRAAIRKFNQLVEDIANRRLDRREVFQRMAELERQLVRASEADQEALDEGLARLARELEKSDLTKPIAKPLEEKRLEDAEQAMRELARKLADKKNPPTKAELERLRKALESASKTSAEWKKNIEERREQLEKEKKRLLQKKKDQGKLSEGERKQLEKNERQLERLDREKHRQEQAQKKMSELDRELAEAARQLMKELGDAAKNVEQGAEDINRMAREEMSDKEKEALKQRIQELRELIRQQGKSGDQRLQQLLRFGQRARGNRPGSGEGDEGQEGEQGKGREGRDGRDGQGEGGEGKGPGQGMGQGRGGEIVIGRGLGGKSIDVPGTGSGEMPGSGQGGGGKEPGEGGGLGGESFGSGKGPDVAGERTNPAGKTKDVAAAGVDTGQGEASAEVIYGAAQRGFVGRGYKKVFTDYQTVAEQLLRKDDIPPGYRFYVRRYFQLIRPRD